MSDKTPKLNTEVKTWRYDFPNINKSSWAIFVFCQDGYFSAITDWGNFSYFWRAHEKADFREFLSKAGTDYMAEKLTNGAMEFSEEKTIASMRELFKELVDQGEMSASKCRRLNAELDDVPFSSHEEFSDWCDEHDLQAHDYARMDHVSEYYHLKEHVLPRLKEFLKQEMAEGR